MINKKRKFYILYFLVFLIALLIFILGTIFKPHNVLMRETDDYLYYKEYTLFGLDSSYHKYHKPIEYDGVVSDKSKSSYFVGVAGKGGHYQTKYKTTVSYNGKTYTHEGFSVYDRYKEGDKVIVIETFYPHYKIDFRHK
jgi:ribosomal protein S17